MALCPEWETDPFVGEATKKKGGELFQCILHSDRSDQRTTLEVSPRSPRLPGPTSWLRRLHVFCVCVRFEGQRHCKCVLIRCRGSTFSALQCKGDSNWQVAAVNTLEQPFWQRWPSDACVYFSLAQTHLIIGSFIYKTLSWQAQCKLVLVPMAPWRGWMSLCCQVSTLAPA